MALQLRLRLLTHSGCLMWWKFPHEIIFDMLSKPNIIMNSFVRSFSLFFCSCLVSILPFFRSLDCIKVHVMHYRLCMWVCESRWNVLLYLNTKPISSITKSFFVQTQKKTSLVYMIFWFSIFHWCVHIEGTVHSIVSPLQRAQIDRIEFSWNI